MLHIYWPYVHDICTGNRSVYNVRIRLFKATTPTTSFFDQTYDFKTSTLPFWTTKSELIVSSPNLIKSITVAGVGKWWSIIHNMLTGENQSHHMHMIRAYVCCVLCMIGTICVDCMSKNWMIFPITWLHTLFVRSIHCGVRWWVPWQASTVMVTSRSAARADPVVIMMILFM